METELLFTPQNRGGVKIGNYSQIAAQCYIIDMDHGTEAEELIFRQKNSVSPVHIGSDVWLAANCTVLKGSVIEDGAILGAKSLVKGHVEKNSISVGIPAKHVRYRGER